MILQCGSPFTIGESEENHPSPASAVYIEQIGPRPNPPWKTSQSPSWIHRRWREKSEQVREPALMSFMELSPEATFILEAEPVMEFDQVRKPALMAMPVGVFVEFEGMEWIPPILPREI